MRTKNLRISELKVELKTTRTFLQAFAADTDNLKFCPTGFLSTVEQVIKHAEKVIEGSDDQQDNNVTSIRS